jgi:DNA primase
MGIVDEDIERVRDASVIADVVQQYVALRRVGRNWVGLCPFHAERSGSFNVRDETGRYKCFGCGAGGDVFRFVQEIEHLDFGAAVELLANRAGIQLRYTTGGESKDRQRRKQLVDVLDRAAAWFHERLLTAPDARVARDYLRGRGLAGDVARRFRLGWAPDDWDALSRDLGVGGDLLRDSGLAFTNRAGRLQDAFRARVMFPITNESGDTVAFGGRVLPGSTDPAKYKNSPETAVYAKSKVLYGLSWAKSDIVAHDQVIVCEGYTDVIGFHRAGIGRAVATCGTALTEDHVRLLTRFAKRVVLAFDADAAGQGAAARFYEWEQRYDVAVSVARLPDGQDPGDLAGRDPDALRAAIDDATPFLGFRLQRVLNARTARSPEERARLARDAMTVVNEHPDINVRKLYAGEVAAVAGLPVADLVAVAQRPKASAEIRVAPQRRQGRGDSAEFVAVALLVQRWDDIAPWLIPELFHQELERRAFDALANSGGDLEVALQAADPEARELLERAAVADVEAEPLVEVRSLVTAAVRRSLQAGGWGDDADSLRHVSEARRTLEDLDDPTTAPTALTWLLGWMSAPRPPAAQPPA